MCTVICTSFLSFLHIGKCNGSYVAKSGKMGTFQSTNYPSNFPARELCKWKIDVANGNIVKLSFPDFFVGTHDPDDCKDLRANVVTVSPTANAFGGSLNLCGNKIPDPVYSIANTMTVQFAGGNADLSKGFNATYEAIPEGDSEYNKSKFFIFYVYTVIQPS